MTSSSTPSTDNSADRAGDGQESSLAPREASHTVARQPGTTTAYYQPPATEALEGNGANSDTNNGTAAELTAYEALDESAVLPPAAPSTEDAPPTEDEAETATEYSITEYSAAKYSTTEYAINDADETYTVDEFLSLPPEPGGDERGEHLKSWSESAVSQAEPLTAEPLAAAGGDGGEPPDNSIVAATAPAAGPPPEISPNAPANDKELDLFEHLGELRSRLLKSILAVALMLGVTWNFGAQLTDWFSRPIRAELARYNSAHGITDTSVFSGNAGLVTTEPMEAFLVYFQVTLVAAILAAMPIILYQMWRFIEPALTRTERRYGLVMVPFSVTLFFAGTLLGYVVSPLFFRFFLVFQPPGTSALFTLGKSAVLLAKMLLVFGVCFQVPVITIFVNKIGLVSRNLLIEHWRHVVVVIFVIVAIITPTWDPLTLVICAVPPCLLYAVSLWVTKWL